MGTVEPTAEGLAALEGLEDDGPLVMINLLRYRGQAAYPDGFAAEPCSGREADQRYGAVATRTVAEVGGSLVWLGAVRATVIAPEHETWDDAVLVQYPSRKAFLDMIARADYQAAAPHRTAALADSRLIACRPLAAPGL